MATTLPVPLHSEKMEASTVLRGDLFNPAPNVTRRVVTAGKVDMAITFMEQQNVSIRAAAVQFGISKSTLHRALVKRSQPLRDHDSRSASTEHSTDAVAPMIESDFAVFEHSELFDLFM